MSLYLGLTLNLLQVSGFVGSGTLLFTPNIFQARAEGLIESALAAKTSSLQGSGFLAAYCQAGLLINAVHPEYVVDAVRERFDRTKHPSNVHLYVVAAVGDGKGRGLGKLAAAGLVTKYTYAW